MIQYKLNNIDEITDYFIDDLWDNEEVIGYQAYYQELDYAYDILKKHNLDKTDLYTDRISFMNFVESISNENYDELINLIHIEDIPVLTLFIENLIAEKKGKKTGMEFETFDVLFFKFLSKASELKTVSLRVGDYIMLGGKNRKAIRKQKKELINTKECFLIHTLKMNRKSIHIFYIKSK